MALSESKRKIVESFEEKHHRLAQAIRQLRDSGAKKQHVRIVLGRETRKCPVTKKAALLFLDKIWDEK